MQAALAQSYNNPPHSNSIAVPIARPKTVSILPSPNPSPDSNKNANSNAVPIAPPDKVVFSPLAHLPMLPPDRREALEHSIEEDNLLHSPPVPSSGKPIQGPVPGTQTSAKNK